MQSNRPSLSAQNLVKDFKDSRLQTVRAVDNLSFELSEGESVAFLGPNGAGKSTTIKMLCRILKPTTGLAMIAGKASGSLAANRELGLVFGTRRQLFMCMTVFQRLDLIAEICFLHGSKKSEGFMLFSIRLRSERFCQSCENALARATDAL